MNKKRKALLLSALASLTILTGCGSKEETKNNTITIDGVTYIQSGDEYTKIDISPRVYEPGTHIINYVFYAENCKYIQKGFGETNFDIPETPEGYSIMEITSLSKNHDHTNGIIIFYVNTERVEVAGEYNVTTGLVEYDKPGVVVQDLTMERGN